MEKTNFNVAPYFDDFNESKNFHKILFRPGYAVQGRELNQLQSILQNQIDRFGAHIFAAGSPVKGGETNLIMDNNYLKLESTNPLTGKNIKVSDFLGLDIVLTGTTSTRARVIAVADSEGVDPPTLMIRYLGGEEFSPGQSIAFADVPSVQIAQIQSASTSIGNGTIATINDGIFFVRGYFVQIPQSTVILNKYSVLPADVNWDVGLQITESVIDETEDSSLLDPALDASNYQAPGAHRLAIYLTWDKRTTDSVDKNEFIVLLKVRDGVIVEQVQHPIYSEIEKTLARRTYDESGNYTVKAFRASVSEDTANSNNYIIRLEAGKAYVFGHEYETIAPTYVTVPKPRNTQQVTGFNLSMDYGNYVFVNNANGLMDITKFDQVDLHVSGSSNIDFANGAAGYANTKIGTARVRDFVQDSYQVASQANTYQYRVHLFDVNTSYLSANAIATGTANSITISGGPQTINQAASGDILGSTIRIVAGTASGGGTRTIVGYTRNAASNNTITVDRPWTYSNTAPDTTSNFIIDWAFGNVESLAKANATGGKVATADITIASKDTTNPYRLAFLEDTAKNSIIFPLSQQFIKDGITNTSYSYRKIFNATLSGTSASLNLSGETFVGTPNANASTSEKTQYWFIVVQSSGGSYSAGQVVAVGDASCTIALNSGATTATVTLAGASGNQITAYALVRTTSNRKSKTKVTGNTIYLASVANGSSVIAGVDANGTAVPGVNVFSTFGQIDFSNTSSISRTSATPQSLFIPDVYQLVKVVQSANNLAAVTAADLSNTAKDITANYTLNSGMYDGYYDHSFIKLKSGAPAPVGQLRVIVNYYDHSGDGYFSVDSYPNVTSQSGYAEIPKYTTEAGTIHALRDVIDFRPRKSVGIANTFSSANGVAASLTTFGLDFRYYLARIDHLVLTRDRRFEVIKGIDSLRPQHPSPKNDAMLLNIVYLPPYVTDANSVVSITSIENKRYTMRDIGTLEKRIESLEYYTSLSLLEQATLNKKDLTLLDDAGLERTKHGILVDTFSDFSASDVSDDYQASLDTIELKLRPSINTDNYEQFFSANGSSNGSYALTGHLLTLPYTSNVALQYQPLATKSVNVNPFNVTKWGGVLGLSPPSDTWISVKTAPPVITNPFAGQPLVVTQLLWNTQQQLFHGSLGAVDTEANRAAMIRNALASIGRDPDVWTTGHLSGINDPNNIFPTSFEFTVESRSTGTRTIQYEEIRTTTGSRLINATILPFCRARPVVFRSKNLRPNTAYYAFFDGVNVTNYIKRSNIVSFEDIVGYTSGKFTEELKDTYGNPDLINMFDKRPVDGASWLGRKVLLSYSNNVGVVVDVGDVNGLPDFAKVAPGLFANTANGYVNGMSMEVVGGFAPYNNTSTFKGIKTVEHYSGNVVSATASSITLNAEAHANAYFYSPSNPNGRQTWQAMASKTPSEWVSLGQDGLVRIVFGTGAGQSQQIQSYNATTRQLTIVGTWTTTPDTTSVYSIGLPRSAINGHCGGVFYLPNTASVQFKTGTRLFKLTDSATNDDTAAKSIAQGQYSASGREEEYREDILTTRRVVSDVTTVQDTIWATQAGWDIADPLAQSFIVDPVTYPMGVHLNRIRTCFATKDAFLPVICQIRPMVNGYPDSKRILAQTGLDPSYVNISPTSPSLSNSAKYTEFTFTTLTYLAPGQEYAVVFLSDSNQYEVWAAEFGTQAINVSDFNPGSAISRQPLLGSVFKSQNGSTWTAVQEEDLMIGVYVCQFDTTKTANVNFKLVAPAGGANANVDLFMQTISDINPPGCLTKYQYTSELATGGYTAPEYFKVLDNTFFNDKLGRRVFSQNNASTFQVFGIMTSNNAYVSPAIDISAGMSVFPVEYRINNGELSNTNLYLVNGGTGYLSTDNANISLSITGGGGSGATAKVSGVNNGVITGIEIVSPGTGYTSTPNLAITFSGNATMRAANTNVAAQIIGETSTSGGNMKARYITKSVTLADGFDSSDLRVFLTGYKPSGSGIYVYYKVLSGEDSDIWENKTWNLMTQLGNSTTISGSKKDFFEMTFAPGTSGVASNEVTYGGFASFRTFQIKVCFTATNPTDVPEFDSIRIIALPSGKVL